jgi:hypothetical protein
MKRRAAEPSEFSIFSRAALAVAIAYVCCLGSWEVSRNLAIVFLTSVLALAVFVTTAAAKTAELHFKLFGCISIDIQIKRK